MYDFKVPEDWNIISLKDLVLKHNSGIYKKKDLYGEGFNIVGVSDLYKHNSIYGQKFRMVPLSQEEVEKHTLEIGDLLYGESSLVRSGIARTLPVLEGGEGTVFAWHTRRLSLDLTKADPSFVSESLSSPHIRRTIEGRATQTALTGITVKDYLATVVPLPPLPEQRKIAAILTSVDETTQATQAVIDQTRRVKEGLLQDLLTKGIGHTRFKKTPIGYMRDFEVPEGWRIANVGDLFEDGRGRVISKNYLASNPGPYPVYSSQTRDHGLFGHIDSFDFEGEYVTWTTDGANAGTAFYRQGRFNCTNVCGTLRPRSSSVFPKFFAYVLNTRTAPYVSRVGNDKLMNNIMRIIPVPLPPLPEQRKIAAILTSVDDTIHENEAHLKQLQQVKAGLLQDLLTGKVRVSV